jgi:hypothetical protein
MPRFIVALAAIAVVDVLAAIGGWAWLSVGLVIVQVALLAVLALVLDRRPTRQFRVVHAIEHAVVALLARRGIHLRSAHSHLEFFVLDVDPAMIEQTRADSVVRETTNEAIRRLAAGEHRLAYHPFCGLAQLVIPMLVLVVGTGLLVASLLGMTTLALVMLAVTLGLVAALGQRRLVLIAQRWSTTPKFVSAAIRAIDVRTVAAGPAFQVAVLLAIVVSHSATF